MKSEKQIEVEFIEKLRDLKYTSREDIHDKATLEANFKKHFERRRFHRLLLYLPHILVKQSEFYK